MRTISDKTEFNLHYILLKESLDYSNLPVNLDFFCTDADTDEPLTISFRCDNEYSFNQILVLSFKDSEGSALNPIGKYSIDGIYGKSGGTEIISEYLLSNFITDIDDPEYLGDCWVDSNDNELILSTCGDIVVDGKPTGVLPPSYGSLTEFTFNNILYKQKFINNLTLAPDFRNLIQQREYPNYDYDFDGPMYGNKRFQHNINKIGLRWWNEHHNIPEFIFEILTHEQKKMLSERLSNLIQLSWESIFRKVFNQKFEVKDDQVDRNMTRDTWGSEMYSSLGGDGEEDVYLSEGISIRPDGTLADD